MKSIIVMGGGVGGLSAAHELSKLGYKVSVYERNDCLGGLARSKLNSKDLPYSYSWRVYGKYYENLRRILEEIPLTTDPNKSVLDNLVDINTYYIADLKHDMYGLNSVGMRQKFKKIKMIFKNFTLKDMFISGKTFLYFLFMSDERLEAYDTVMWKEYMSRLSPAAKNYIIRSVGPFYGMDIDNVSVFSVIYCFYSALIYVFSSVKLSVMNAPTNMAWFDHWQPFLESKSVEIHLNHVIDSVSIKNGKVQQVTVINQLTQEQQTITADYYICGLSVEEVSKTFHFLDSMKMPNLDLLAQKSRQIQLSIQLYLDDRLIFPDHNSILWLPDSPWALIIESQLSLWGHYEYINGSIKDILSVGICDWSTKGLKVKKAFIDCTFPEIIEEVWFQIQSCPGLHKLPTLENKTLTDIKILDHSVWESFHVNKQHKVDTWEPKFGNNTECYLLSPNTKEGIENLFFATAYTKNTTKIFTMDSAAESGINAAREVLKSEQQSPDLVKIIEYPRPLNSYVGWIRRLDGALYRKKNKKTNS